MNYGKGELPSSCDVAIIGTGMGSLAAAIYLTHCGYNVAMVEQNWQPGGCTTSYWRKNFVYEAGATTVVGLEADKPLGWLLHKTGIEIPHRKLEYPMQVHFPDGKQLMRHYHIQRWIEEAKTFFGSKGQEEFWSKCYRISKFVWQSSVRFRHFPPARISDFLQLIKGARPSQLPFIPFAFQNVASELKKHKLPHDGNFGAFINEQLLITAQNTMKEVNMLFGSTALCYTNFPNYYIDGGLANLVKPLVSYLEKHGAKISFRNPVTAIEKSQSMYTLKTKNGELTAKAVISGIPLNNTMELANFEVKPKLKSQLKKSKALVSAFQMGLGLEKSISSLALHHQVILDKPLPIIGSKSYFISLAHPEDNSRSKVNGGQAVSVSTHIFDPEGTVIERPEEIEQAIINDLHERKLIDRNSILEYHSSTPGSWKKWTNRAFGSVGGYPQTMDVKPWEMVEARLDGEGLYLCGDTAYPGQGIPGASLSGIIAAEKLMGDWGKR